MRRMVLGALLVAGMAGIAGTALADPVEGVWQTQPGDDGAFGHVQIAPCGPALCGVLVRAYDGQGKSVQTPNVGRQIVWDMVAQGDGAYGNGKIWAPDRDKTYASKMALEGDRLNVSGCVLGICRTQIWARVK